MKWFGKHETIKINNCCNGCLSILAPRSISLQVTFDSDSNLLLGSIILFFELYFLLMSPFDSSWYWFGWNPIVEQKSFPFIVLNSIVFVVPRLPKVNIEYFILVEVAVGLGRLPSAGRFVPPAGRFAFERQYLWGVFK